MHKLRKTIILSLVSVLTFSLGITPAFANPFDTQLSATNELSSIAPQSLNTEINTASAVPLDRMLDITATETASTHSFDVEAAIALAKQEVGTSRATGWSQPGECIMSAQRWIQAGGGNWVGGGTPVTNYETATRVPLSLVEPGDVIQYEHMLAPHAWVSGVHTLLITGVNEDGTFSIVESNVPYGSGLVTQTESWTPDPPFGFQAVAWRF